VRKQRLARAATKKERFTRELAAKLDHFQHDHTYSSRHNETAVENLSDKSSTGQSPLCNILYMHQVSISSSQAIELEAKTRTQFASEVWHNERKFRITASIMKEVCHRKSSTDCKAFVEKKLFSKPLEPPAICYGRKHEDDAISSYVKCKKSCGIFVDERVCGLVIDSSIPWLAASPDRIIMGMQRWRKGRVLRSQVPLCM